MNFIRKTTSIELNVGDGMANGLFNVSDKSGNVSYWFDIERKDELMRLSTDLFNLMCGDMIKLAN